jgi:taurine dioxygenase
MLPVRITLAHFIEFPRQLSEVGGRAGKHDASKIGKVADLMRRSMHKWRHCDWVLCDWMLWDNRSVMHQANPDYAMHQRRYLYRLMLKGGTPA